MILTLFSVCLPSLLDGIASFRLLVLFFFKPVALSLSNTDFGPPWQLAPKVRSIILKIDPLKYSYSKFEIKICFC